MADPQGRSKIVMETLGRLHELAVNLTTSNLAKQEEGSDTLLSVCQALETNDAVAYHLAALAVELSPTEVSDAQELAFVISAAASPFTQMLDVEDLNAIYDCRPDSDLDCAHVDRSLANVGHYLCELSVSELTFPCLGCPLVRRQFPDWRQRPERATEPPASATGAPVADSPRHPGPPARRMMLDLTDAINQLTQLDLTDLPAESPIRRRLAYIAIALAQEASYGADINYCALIEMAQLSRDEAWRESEPQVERVAAIERTLYETATGRPFTDPKPGDRKSECERVFQARDNSERFYCAHSDYIPTHLGEDETVAQMCQECPFHQNPRPPGLAELLGV